MADTKNEAPAADEAPVRNESTAAPATVVREKRGWTTPLVAALVVAGALVLGGAGGFALATAVHADGRPPLEQAGFPGAGESQPGPPRADGRFGQAPHGPGTDRRPPHPLERLDDEPAPADGSGESEG